MTITSLTPGTPGTRTDADLIGSNRKFYDALWRDARLFSPDRFNTWPLVSELAARSTSRLEVAPGLRPRLPLNDTQFVDLSRPALSELHRHGARVAHAMIGALPFKDGSFDFVCAFDILEHVVDDEGALGELARVAQPSASLLLSVPLHPSAWNAFDEFVGHYRRYEPEAITALLARHGFTIERSAIYGMQPKSSKLLDLGQWYLTHQRERAMWWYNKVFMPLGVRFQKPLALKDGFHPGADVDEVLLVCRKAL
ncbi:SAM-dependent methyltransferase [Luteibacter sp. Sphag1AF]|uniref:class I SAM-dependent methyltransferase n=1 Tax=Luteibacter sp. Sphag1AF TaxID=2587031 RepID=UPI00160E0D39|nr:methyltransferase domain-containing protein [Luteibacter sp. Sphag1AF]MBB3225727.1 SAM-dependent methyltransferase [Luteibacter sp. Sphag1AF]